MGAAGAGRPAGMSNTGLPVMPGMVAATGVGADLPPAAGAALGVVAVTCEGTDP